MVDRFSFGTPNKMVAFTALSAVIIIFGGWVMDYSKTNNNNAIF